MCACIVPAAGRAPSLADLRAELAASVARQRLPDELCVLEAIPRSAVGKVDRAGLVAQVVQGDIPRAGFRPAVTSAQ